MKHFLFFSVGVGVGLAFCLWGAPACAASSMSRKAPSMASSAQEMLDISAQESLEWYEDQRLYVARGQARATQGDKVVEADILTAHTPDQQTKTDAQKPAGQGGDIDRLTAEGRVHIYDAKQEVFGDKAVYDLREKVAKVTGSNLKYQTSKSVVTAQKSLEFYEKENVALARGQAMAAQDGNRIEADIISAHLVNSEAGSLEMKEMRAEGHVILVTKDGDVVRGDHAVYDVKKDEAVLKDNVRITKGEIQLAGDQALVDFKTGQSRLINSGSGRVRALLPTSGAKKNKE